MEPRTARNGRPAADGRPGRAESKARAKKTGSAPESADAAPARIGEHSETGVLLDALIHDLRTPLSAMSGWLEVLEAHFGEAEGIVGRALLGLRRGVEGQTRTLNGISDVLTKQRMLLPDDDRCNLLEQLQEALNAMDGQSESPLDASELARLAPVRAFAGESTLACPGGGSTLRDACGTLLHAVAVAQGEDDAQIAIATEGDEIRIRIPGTSGDLSSLESLINGLRPHAPRRPHIRPQALWLARSVFQRCSLRLQLFAGPENGVELLIGRGEPASGSLDPAHAG